MKKEELITNLANRLASTKADAAKALNTVLNCIKDNLYDAKEIK